MPRDCRRGILVVLVYHPAAEEPAQSSILILAVYFILYGPPTPGRHKYISLCTARLRVEQISNISGWEEEEEVPVPGSSRALASLRRGGYLDLHPPGSRGRYLSVPAPSSSLQSRLVRDHPKGRKLANTSTELARRVEPPHLYADWSPPDSDDDDVPPAPRSMRPDHLRLAQNLDTRSLDAQIRDAVHLSRTTDWSRPHSDDDDEPPVRRPKGPDRLWHLAMAYSHQYDKYADLKDLEGAIKNKASSIQLIDIGHPQRAARLQSLAVPSCNASAAGECQDIDIAIPTFNKR
ncbi:hypothetical protein B0H13DRAFT_1868421 [Mycena leptocephala]|nr:hypothetical protein B0H13DRAFT_1868421 [Mycena leptocephala]